MGTASGIPCQEGQAAGDTSPTSSQLPIKSVRALRRGGEGSQWSRARLVRMGPAWDGCTRPASFLLHAHAHAHQHDTTPSPSPSLPASLPPPRPHTHTLCVRAGRRAEFLVQWFEVQHPHGEATASVRLHSKCLETLRPVDLEKKDAKYRLIDPPPPWAGSVPLTIDA